MTCYRGPRTNRTSSYLLADLSHIAVREHIKVSFQASVMHGFPVTLSFERATEANVLPNRGILWVISVRLDFDKTEN